MTGIVARTLAASVGLALAAYTVQAQSITGLERGGRASPMELLTQLQGHQMPVADDSGVGAAALEETVEAVIVALEQPLKTHGASRFTRDQVVALKVAMLRAEMDVRDVARAVTSGELPAAEGRVHVVSTLSDYTALVRELHASSASSSTGADRR